MKTITYSLNIKHVVLLVVTTCMLLSVFFVLPQAAGAQSAEAEEQGKDENFVSEELVAQLEALRALVEELVVLVEAVRAQRSSDVGSSVSTGATGLGENIVRAFVDGRLATIRYRESKEEALKICQDAVRLSPIDEGYGESNSVRCTWNGETILADVIREGSGRVSTQSGTSGLSADGLDGDGTSGSGLPDLTVSDGAFENTATYLSFNYRLENEGAGPLSNSVRMLLEVDVGCNGGVEYLRTFTTGADRIISGDTHTGFYRFDKSLSNNNFLAENARGCFRFTADHLESVTSPDVERSESLQNVGFIFESNEDNNSSDWVNFGGFTGEPGDGEGAAPINCPDGFYWDDRESLCIDTSV